MIGRSGLFGAALIGIARERARRRLRRAMVLGLLGGLAALMAVFMLGFLGLAAVYALERPMGREGAALVVAAGFAVIAAALALAAAIVARRDPPPPPILPVAGAAGEAVAEGVADLGRTARRAMRDNAPTLALLAFIAGFMASRR